MTETVYVRKQNEVYNVIDAEPSIRMELSEHFTFKVPGYRFNPKYKAGYWDGNIRLYNLTLGTLYAGLLRQVEKFCADRGYAIEYLSDFNQTEFSVVEAEEFIATLGLPKELKGEPFVPHDYQVGTFIKGVRDSRALFLSPTSSGKSLMIYFLTRYYNRRTLIIVPTTALIHQMFGDFKDYGYDSEANMHLVYSGQEKYSSKQIVVGTWQSITKLPKQWLDMFEVVIGDEAHLFNAKSLKEIMEKMTDCNLRFGFTGSLDESKTHRLVLEGLFGPVRKVITTAELIERGAISPLEIKCLVLKYPDDVRKKLKGATYQEEIDFLTSCEPRNRYICNLARSLKGNTLLLFNYVEKHGKVIYDKLLSGVDVSRKVFFVHGGVDGAERNEIRAIVEKEPDAIIVASYGTFSTGINIRNIHNIIFASPTKSRIRNLQSIGRGLRRSSEKEKCTLYDVADDLTWKKSQNHTLKHFVSRVKIYNEEKFPYRPYNINLKFNLPGQSDTLSSLMA